jgi:nitrilase
MAIDEAKLNAFMGGFVSDLGAVMHAATVVVGDQLGLYKRLAEEPAREGGCWVVGCGCALQGRDLADGLLDEAGLYPDAEEWINPGDSVIVAPGGKIVAGPLHEEFGVLVAEIDLERVGLAQRSLDVCGHYARPDIFRLQDNTRRFAPVEFAAHE